MPDAGCRDRVKTGSTDTALMFAARSNLLRTIRCKIATLTPCEVGNVWHSPFYPQQRTLAFNRATSEMCQIRKFDQSITSALTRTDSGIVTPSALAVFMLMTKSKRVGP